MSKHIDMGTTGNGGGLLLLHLSDIHFRDPYCLNPDTDQDHPVRTALVNDIRAMVKKVGHVNAILISGDIAYNGHHEEYKAAARWLSEVREASDCPESCTFVVPGNHDVDRNAAEARTLQGIRTLIFDKAPGALRDKELHDTLLDSKSGPELFTPMAEYGLFAASFGCDLDRERPFWAECLDKDLAPGWKLKMHGLTTTFFSGPGDDTKGDLYLGALQRAFAPDDGIVRVALLHHPPDWLGDADNLDDALWEGCALHLLGHKHRQRYLPGLNGVRLGAGAVNPSRTDGTWEPGYNFIKLRVIPGSPKHTLHIESHLRIWQTSPDGFVPKKNGAGGEVFIHDITLRRDPLPVIPVNDQTDVSEEKVGVVKMIRGAANNCSEKTIIVGVEGSPEGRVNQRDVVFHFWQLSPSQRRKVMQDLKLLEPDDDQLPETQRYRRAFERARQRGIVENLKTEISKINS